MRVLFNVFLDLRSDGAGVTHFVELAQSLQKRDHEILAIAPGYPPGPQKDRGIHTWFVPTLPKSLPSAVVYEFLAIFFFLFALIYFRPTVVYSRRGLGSLIPPMLSRLLGVPYLVEVNGVTTDEMKARGLDWWMIRIANFVSRWNLRWCTSAICVSQGVGDEISRRYNVPSFKIAVLPNGVAVDRFLPRDRVACRTELGLPQDAFIAGFVGSMAPWQGLDTVLSSVEHIKDSYTELSSDLLLLIVGDGEVRPRIEERIRSRKLENVLITGWVPYDKVPQYMGAFDVCLLTVEDVGSLKTSYRSPLKVFEYLACGRVVIATEIEGIEILNVDESYLLLIPQQQPIAMANALDCCYRSRGQLLEWGQQASEEVSAQHSWGDVAGRLEEIMLELVNR